MMAEEVVFDVDADNAERYEARRMFERAAGCYAAYLGDENEYSVWCQSEMSKLESVETT